MKTFFTIIFSLVALMTTHCQTQQRFKRVDANEFKKIISVPNIQLIDVRTKSEFETGHIPDAVNINIQDPDFDKSVEKLNKNYPVAVYCRSGRRSLDAAKKLDQKGYIVYDLDGGIIDWENSGYKIQK